MRNWIKAGAGLLTLGAVASAMAQDTTTTTTTTNLFTSLGALGPILAILAIALWIRWGGLKLFTGD